MRLGYRFLIAGTVLGLLSNASSASVPGYLKLSPDVSGDGCEIADPGPGGIVTVYVVARGFDGVAGFHFSAPVPANSGLVHVSDQTTFYPVGSSQSGTDVALGTCEPGTFVVMEMKFVRATQGDACTFYGAEPGAKQMDCLFQEWPIQVVGVMLNSDGTCNQAKQPGPADGAVHVPVTTSLSWKTGYTCFLSTSSALFFGTDPNPPQIAVGIESPYPVGTLQFNTRYYWKVADPGAGPVWSFVTESGVAAKQSTWGSIKALYR